VALRAARRRGGGGGLGGCGMLPVGLPGNSSSSSRSERAAGTPWVHPAGVELHSVGAAPASQPAT